MMEAKFTPGDLRVWWIPQVPMKPFEVDVPDVRTAAILVDTLANYDLFQFENNIKPDYCNAGGLMVFEDGEWTDWYDPATGADFDEVRDDPEALRAAIARARAQAPAPGEGGEG